MKFKYQRMVRGNKQQKWHVFTDGGLHNLTSLCGCSGWIDPRNVQHLPRFKNLEHVTHDAAANMNLDVCTNCKKSPVYKAAQSG